MYLLMIAVIAFFAILWFFMHLRDRRRMINGLTFIISMGSIFVLVMLVGASMEDDLLTSILIIFSFVLILAAPLAILSGIILLFSTGIKLIKREGFSLAHALSFLLGFAIIGVTLFAPIIISKTNFRFIKASVSLMYALFIYFLFVFVIFLVAATVYFIAPYRYNKDYIIVLGAGLIEDQVTPLLAARIDKAIVLYHKQIERNKKVPTIIMSGGQGADEGVSEAYAMKEYAVLKGIPADDIILEDQSTSTEENLTFSRILIEERTHDYKAVFVTSKYHVFRSALIARKIGFNVNGQGSRVKLYYFVSALIREYIGILVLNPKFHIFMSAIIIFLNIFVWYLVN